MAVYRGDYTQRDADNIRTENVSYLTRNYPGVALDFSDNSVALEAILLDVIVHDADALHLYVDAAFSEAFVDTAVESQSLQSLAKLVACPLGRRNAASVELTYTYTKTDPGAPNSILLPVGFSLPNDSGFSWTVVDALQTVDVAGGTFEAMQGAFVTETFTSTGEPNQVFVMSNRRIAANVDPSVDVAMVGWAAADQISRCGAGQYYEVRWVGYGRLAIMFGDGTNGDIPPIGNSIEVTFFSTDGAAANCPANTVVGIAKPHADVDLEYSNDDAVYDGNDGLEVRDARRFIAGYGSRAGTEVTESDYKTIVEAQSGVRVCNFSFDEATRRVVCYVLSSSWGALTDGQLARLARTMRGKQQMFTSAVFKNVTIVKGVVALKVVFDRASRLDTNLKRQTVVDAIEDFFEPPTGAEMTNDVGKTVRLSDFFRTVDSVEGVDHLNLDVFTRWPELVPLSWSESGSTIALSGWHLRPSSMVFGSAGVGAGLQTALGTLAAVGDSRIYRRSTTPASGTALKVVGARAATDDWTMRASGAYPDKIKVRLSTESRKYVWPSWQAADGSVPEPLTDALPSRAGLQTGHFAVSHVVSGTEYVDSAIGYLDKVYEMDGGFMLFKLTATSALHNIIGPVDCDGVNWGYFDVPGGLLEPGTLQGFLTIGATTYAVSDDSDGGIFSANEDKLGYVDYDTGWLVFSLAAMPVCGVRLDLDYRQYSFDNAIGEEAEIFVSPLVGDIKVRPNEFVSLYELNVEIATD